MRNTQNSKYATKSALQSAPEMHILCNTYYGYFVQGVSDKIDRFFKI